MKYLIVQEWNSTRGNHAGMSHMCDMLVARYPQQYIKITKEAPMPVKSLKNRLLGKLFNKALYYLHRRQYAQEYTKLCKQFFDKLRKDDEVFLLEYNWPETTQYELARYIRNNFNEVRIYALSHITPTIFSKRKNIAKQINKWDVPINIQLTLGTSLADYFVSLGLKRAKISIGKHYVDLDYYSKQEHDIKINDRITIIAMGNLQRKYEMLAEIVRKCPDINWIICKGRKKNVDHLFPKSPNIKLMGYLSEEELRHQMDVSDVSLNVFEDTVGSNVITTSMAMGLVILTSDVGSIHDYCDSSNAIFCENSVDSFVTNIKALPTKHDIRAMKLSSLKKSRNFGIDMVDYWFNTLNK